MGNVSIAFLLETQPEKLFLWYRLEDDSKQDNMIPIIGTVTLPALSVIAGILVIFLLVTVPDWYKRYVQQNEKKKKIDEQGDAKPSSKYVQKSKPCIELNKILKEEENASKGACGCEDKNDKNERQDGCCKGDTNNVDI